MAPALFISPIRGVTGLTIFGRLPRSRRCCRTVLRNCWLLGGTIRRLLQRIGAARGGRRGTASRTRWVRGARSILARLTRLAGLRRDGRASVTSRVRSHAQLIGYLSSMSDVFSAASL